MLTKFGGHPKAGGFSLPADRVEDFRQMVYAFCREYYPKMPEYTVSAGACSALLSSSHANASAASRMKGE